MGERVVYPQWRNMAEENNYPFADWCVVPSGLADVFVDASLFLPADGPAYLSRISVSEERVLVEVRQGGETATGTVERGSSVDLIKLNSPEGFSRGALVGRRGFAALFVLPVGDTTFTAADTEFVARAVAPLPRNGVTSISVGNERLIGEVTLVAEHGVRFVPGETIRVDVTGVPAGADYDGKVKRSGIRTINFHAPGDGGVFRLVSSVALASDSALRISAGDHSLLFSLAGVK